MCDEIKRTLFSGDVIVANDIVAIQVAGFTQPCGQFYVGLVGCIGELPGIIRVADFDGYGVLIPVIAGGRFLIQWDTLYDFTIQPNDKMGTDIGGWTCIVVPVLLGSGAMIAHIVDHNIPDTLQICTPAGITINFYYLPIDPVWDRSIYQFKNLFSGNNLILVDMPSACQNYQEQNKLEQSFHGLANLLGAELPVHDRNQNCRKNRVNHKQQGPCAHYGEAQIVHIKVFEVLHKI